ncbi:glycosyltransferase family 4 protein [Thermaurantiacus sp.]
MLTRYSRLGASSRLRMLQYVPALKTAGFEIAADPLFTDSYLESLYDKKGSPTQVMRLMGKRVAALRQSREAELIWIEKEALPFVPWVMERQFWPRKPRIVVDLDDAVFHRYDLHTNPAVRRILGGKIDNVMAAADLVIAGNSYLAERAHCAGARAVEIVPTVVDTEVYQTGSLGSPGGLPVIGWIGTPETWEAFSGPLLPLLSRLVAQGRALVRVVGGRAPATPMSGFEFLPWSEETEVDLIRGMDIGIMPLDDSPWSRGKCGYKLIQYMACGLPVVASPVGVNREIVEQGENGFLAAGEQQWYDALVTLLGDARLRQRMGASGRANVEARYSLQMTAPRMIDLFTSLLGQRR